MVYNIENAEFDPKLVGTASFFRIIVYFQNVKATDKLYLPIRCNIFSEESLRYTPYLKKKVLDKPVWIFDSLTVCCYDVVKCMFREALFVGYFR